MSYFEPDWNGDSTAEAIWTKAIEDCPAIARAYDKWASGQKLCCFNQEQIDALIDTVYKLVYKVAYDRGHDDGREAEHYYQKETREREETQV